MENSWFPQLQATLKPGFVEARLHTDLTSSHETFKFSPRIQELREHFLGKGNKSRPQYVVVDPAAPKKILSAKFDGAAGSPEDFRAFLKEGLAEAKKPAK